MRLKAVPGLAEHSERRSLILCAVGAVIGLIIAGMGLFSAQGTRIAGVPAEDVALVNQVPILLSDYEVQLKTTEDVSIAQATPEQKRRILDEMIREELYVQRGVELGLQADSIEVRQAMVTAVEAQQSVDASASAPTIAELRAFYDRNRSRYASLGLMTVGDYRTADLAAAQRAAAAIRAGAPPAAALAAAGLKTTGVVDDGEEFYFAARIHLGPRLFAAAERLSAGEASHPITMPDGIHVIVMTQNTAPQLQPFEAVADQVLADLRNDKIARMQASADHYLRRRADIQIAKGYE